MNCPHCKNALPQGSVFCPYCGVKLQPKTDASGPSIAHGIKDMPDALAKEKAQQESAPAPAPAQQQESTANAAPNALQEKGQQAAQNAPQQAEKSAPNEPYSAFLEDQQETEPLFLRAYQAYTSTEEEKQKFLQQLLGSAELRSAYLAECDRLQREQKYKVKRNYKQSYLDFMAMLHRVYFSGQEGAEPSGLPVNESKVQKNFGQLEGQTKRA